MWAAILAAGSILCSTAMTHAVELRTVQGGVIDLTFHQPTLDRLGVSIADLSNKTSTATNAPMVFPILPDAALTVELDGRVVQPLLEGELVAAGQLQISVDGMSSALHELRFVPTNGLIAGGRLTDALSGSAGGFVLDRMKIGFDPGSEQLTIHAESVSISRAWAEAVGRPELAGQAIARMTIHGDTTWVQSTPSLVPQPQPGNTPAGLRDDGPDMTFCQLYGLAQFGREEDKVGLAVATTSWNVGNEDLMWFSMNDAPELRELHPFIVMNLFRLKDGQFDQIGQSWIKHGFYALGNTQCGGSCSFESGHSAGDWLGQNCTDTYTSGLNAGQNGLGPRYEIDPWDGTWEYDGSHNAQGSHSHNGIDHRIIVSDSDLDPAQNAGAQYFVEGYYVMLDDVNVWNSAAWKPTTVTGSPGGTWNFEMTGSGELPEVGFAFDAWGQNDEGVIYTEVAQELPVIEFVSPDGRCMLAAKATELLDGWWHYDYALYNLDMDRQVGSFKVPLTPGAPIENIGFHASEHQMEPLNAIDGVPIDNEPWTATLDDDGYIIWSTTTNPLRWGSMHSFRFDAQVPPAEEYGEIEMGLFKPGTPNAVYASTVTPVQGPPDCDGDDIPDPCEISCDAVILNGSCQVAGCGTSLDCNANEIPDDCESDCNGNGVPDDCDIAGGTSFDADGNDFPDECRVMRVNAAAPAGGHGASWAGALNSLDAALIKAELYKGKIEEIWIAGGTYVPDSAGLTNPRSASFKLVDNVAVYGGFAGTESLLEERDPVANLTILSGDLTGNDAPGFANMEENAYHVVQAFTSGTNATLSGVTITGGYADVPPINMNGGGVYIDNREPVIDHCTIIGNKAIAGGGVYIRGQIAPTIVNSKIYANQAVNIGGGLTNVLSSPMIANTLFVGNGAPNGGAVFVNGGAPTFLNSVMIANAATQQGGGLRNAGNLTMVNSILWGNSDMGGVDESAQVSLLGGLVDVHHTAIQGLASLAGNDNVGLDPKFITLPSDGGDGWGMGGNDDYGDLSLYADSPCVDAGDSSVVPGWISEDIAGNMRVQGPAVDIGAYERAAEQTPGACCVVGACSDLADEALCVPFVCNVTTNELPDCGGACGTTCYGDVNGDGVVTVSDRGFISANVGNTDPAVLCQFDLDGNGAITVSDRGFVSANIGVCTELPSFQDGSGLVNGEPDTRFGTATFFPGLTCETVTCE